MMIQKLRLQHGWSQEQLAELSGLSVRTIQRIERGQTPSVETLKSIAAVFDVDFSTLRELPMETAINPATGNQTNASTEEALAFAHVRKVKGFYLHAMQFCLVVGALAIVNVVFYPRHLWVLWIVLGWGSGLLVHGLRVFDKVPFLTGEWERAQVEKQLGRKL